MPSRLWEPCSFSNKNTFTCGLVGAAVVDEIWDGGDLTRSRDFPLSLSKLRYEEARRLSKVSEGHLTLSPPFVPTWLAQNLSKSLLTSASDMNRAGPGERSLALFLPLYICALPS